MKLKLTIGSEPKHEGMASAVGWATSDEVLSCADDHKLLTWNLISGETHKLAELPASLYPTDIHWYPRGLGGGSKKGGGGTDLFVLAATDGKFYLVSKSGRVEKTVEAHKGAVLCVRWSLDGASLLTLGEDGAGKIWSRSGMLRSTMCQHPSPVYTGAWAPDNSAILYANHHTLTIKPIQANAKATQWVGHEGVILATDWSPSNSFIISGAEDRKYKVWDSFGRVLFSSAPYEFPITSVSWATDGELFAVGAYDLIRLCDKAGWSHSMEKPRAGSVFALRWSPDGTQLAGACGSGHVVFANVIEKRVEWESLEAVSTKRKIVEVRNMGDGSREKLELRDRVTNFSLHSDHLVVTTPAQCYVYSSHNWNTPQIFDLKEGMVSLILMSSKCFLLVDGGSLLCYSYEGRPLGQIKFPGMRTELIGPRTLALASDALAVLERNDQKTILLFDPNNGKPVGDAKITHTQEILELGIDQTGPVSERRVAFIDKNNDLFVSALKSFGSASKVAKIGSMMSGLGFNDRAPMLVALGEGKLLLYTFPSVAYVDKELLPATIIEKELSSVGSKPPRLLSFWGSTVRLRRSEGSVLPVALSPFPLALHGHLAKNKWDLGLRLCRHLKDDHLWAMLAGMASYSKNLNTAEMAYSAINEAEKVELLSGVGRASGKEVKAAELALSKGAWREAEGTLLQGGLIPRAILLNISMFRWNRALELAVKHKTHVDTVLGYRQRYLDDFGRKETEKLFIDYNGEVEVDWDHIQERVAAELKK